MSTVLLVHGVGHQFGGPDSLLTLWGPALRDGLRGRRRAGPAVDIACAFYGDLFRPAGGKSPIADYSAEDVEPGLETDLLLAWWASAAAIEGIPGPDEQAKARSPRVVQTAVRVLLGTRYFSAITERFLIGGLKQVSRYFKDETIRASAQRAVTSAITPKTRVVVAHSLGSIVAWEALFATNDNRVTFVTLGSPLGLRGLISDRLRPVPNGQSRWPPSVRQWTNIADRGDIVAAAAELRPVFGGELQDLLINNGADAHNAARYLTARETGEAIAAGL